MRYATGIPSAAAQDKMTYGTLADPAVAAATWAIVNGEVKSDKLTVDGNSGGEFMAQRATMPRMSSTSRSASPDNSHG